MPQSFQQSRRYLTEVEAADGHRFQTYVSEPWGTAIWGLVLIHEITGLNAYVRAMG